MRIFLDKFQKNRKGFTLAEILIVVAIIAILANFGFVAVSRYNKQLTLMEMDDTAKKIFLAAQNHLTIADTNGEWKQFVLNNGKRTGETGEEGSLGNPCTIDGKDYFVIFGGKSESVNTKATRQIMLPDLSVNIAGDGSYAIVYDATTATIYGVYYSASSTFGNGQNDNDFVSVITTDVGTSTENSLRLKTKRKEKKNPIIGYYGSNAQGVKKEENTEIKTLQKLKVYFINSKELTLVIEDPNASLYYHNGSSEISQREFYISVKNPSVSDEKQTYTLMATAVNDNYTELKGSIKDFIDQNNISTSSFSISKSISNPAPAGEGNMKLYALKSGTVINDKGGSSPKEFIYFITFDSLTKQNQHFAKLFPAISAGEDVTASVTMTVDLEGNISSAGGSATDNSLFDQITMTKVTSAEETKASEYETARITNVRHLENLSPDISNMNPGIRAAVLGKDIDLNGTEGWINGTSSAYPSIYKFDDSKLIGLDENANIAGIALNGNFARFNGNGKTISNMRVSYDAYANGQKPTALGLFTMIPISEDTSSLTISNLKIDAPIIAGGATTSAGILIGNAKKSLTLRNIVVKNSVSGLESTVKASGVTGGLLGTFSGTSFSASKVSVKDNLSVKSTGNVSGGLAGSIIADTVSVENVTIDPDTYQDASGRRSRTTNGHVWIGSDGTQISDGGADASHVGGLVGYLKLSSTAQSTISKSYVLGGNTGYVAVSNAGSAGGLIGKTEGGNLSIQDTHVSTYVQSAGAYGAGGFIGEISGGNVNVSESYVGGRTSGTYYINETLAIDTNVNESTLANKTGRYNVQALNSKENTAAGGFIGKIDNNAIVAISNSYTTASVYISGTAGSSGGFIGSNAGNLSCGNTYTTALVHREDNTETNADMYIGSASNTITLLNGGSNYAVEGIYGVTRANAEEQIDNVKACGSAQVQPVVTINASELSEINGSAAGDALPYDTALSDDYPLKNITELSSGKLTTGHSVTLCKKHEGDWPTPKATEKRDQTYDGDFGVLYYEVVQHGYNGSKDYYFHGFVGDLTDTGERQNYEEVWTDDSEHLGEGHSKLTLPNNGKGLLTGHNEYVVEEGYLILVGNQYIEEKVTKKDDPSVKNTNNKYYDDLAVKIGGFGGSNDTRLDVRDWDEGYSHQYVSEYDYTLDDNNQLSNSTICDRLGLKGYIAYCIKVNDSNFISEASKKTTLNISLQTYMNGNKKGGPKQQATFYFQPIFSDTLSENDPEGSQYSQYKIRSAAQLNRMLGHGGNSAVSSLQHVLPIIQTLDISYNKKLNFTEFNTTSHNQEPVSTSSDAYISPTWTNQLNSSYSGSFPANETAADSPVESKDPYMETGPDTYYRLRSLNKPLFGNIGRGRVSYLRIEDTNSNCFISQINEASSYLQLNTVDFINCRFSGAPVNYLIKGSIKNCNVINGQMGWAGLVGQMSDGSSSIENCHIFSNQNLAMNSDQTDNHYVPNANTIDDTLADNDKEYGYNLVTIGKIPDSNELSPQDVHAGFIGAVYNSGKIINCSFTGKVYGKNAAGFVGSVQNNNPEITKCYSNALVYGEEKAAAFIYEISAGVIDRCHALGIIGGSGSGSGFISNYSGGTVANSYSAVWKVLSNSYDPFAGKGSDEKFNTCYVMRDVDVPSGLNSSDWVSSEYRSVNFKSNTEMSGLTGDLGIKATSDKTVAYYQYLPQGETTYPYAMPANMMAYGDWGQTTYSLSATVVNGEDLSLVITDPEISNGFSAERTRYTFKLTGVKSDYSVEVQLKVIPTSSGETIGTGKVQVTVTPFNEKTAYSDDPITLKSDMNFHGQWEAKSNRTETKILFDSVTSQNGHFAQLFPESQTGFISGEDIKITDLKAQSLTTNGLYENISISNAPFNSLFESRDMDNSSIVNLSTRRHLENLSTDISGINSRADINTAKLNSSVNFASLSGFIDSYSASGPIYSLTGTAFSKTGAYSDTNYANLAGVHNDQLTTFNGQGYTLSRIRVKGEDTSASEAIKSITGYEDAALFTSLGASNVTIRDIIFSTTTSSSSIGSAAVVLARTNGNGSVTVNNIIISGPTNLSVTNGTGNVGSIVGTAGGYGSLTINNSLLKDTGNITSTNNAGGIIGDTLNSCKVSLNGCNVNGSIAIESIGNGGGLLGSIGPEDKDHYSQNAVYINCSSASISLVSAEKQTGGLIGGCYGKSIAIESSYAGGQNMYVHCISQAKASDTNSAGGLIGDLRTNAKINNSAASCYVDASESDSAGGFIGSIKADAEISYCYVGGHTNTDGKYENSLYNGNTVGGYNVIGYTATGGFIGYMAGTIRINDCFTAASVNGTTADNKKETGRGYIGGFIGQTQANQNETFTNCYAAGKIFGWGHNSKNYGGAFIGNINTRKKNTNDNTFEPRPFNLVFSQENPNYVLTGMTYHNETDSSINNDDTLVGMLYTNDQNVYDYNDNYYAYKEQLKAAVDKGIKEKSASDLTKLALSYQATTARFAGSGKYPYPVYTSLPDYSQDVVINNDGTVSAKQYNRVYYGDWEALASQIVPAYIVIDTISGNVVNVKISLKYKYVGQGQQQYYLLITNKESDKLSTVTVMLKTYGKITQIGGNVSGTINGDIVSITTNNWENGFNTDQEVSLYMEAYGNDDFGFSINDQQSSQAKQNSPAGLTDAPQQTVTRKIKVSRKAS